MNYYFNNASFFRIIILVPSKVKILLISVPIWKAKARELAAPLESHSDTETQSLFWSMMSRSDKEVLLFIIIL